jgi:large subunit ribosomal protein L10
MENPRPEKVAVVDEVREKLSSADAVLLTEYRGLKVSELAELRTAIRPAGGEYRVYKNTLVRFAAQELDYDLDDVLTGPTALAFVTTKADGTPGDVAAVAKALQTFTKGNPLLVLKGGILGDTILDANGAKALASLPTAAEIYARLAGAIQSGARGLAGAISGVPRSVAYVLQAAIDAGAFAGDAPSPSAADAAAPEATDEVATPDVTDEAAPETETDETPADDSEPAADGDES